MEEYYSGLNIGLFLLSCAGTYSIISRARTRRREIKSKALNDRYEKYALACDLYRKRRSDLTFDLIKEGKSLEEVSEALKILKDQMPSKRDFDLPY